MEIKHFEIDVDGLKILFTNDPKLVGTTRYLKNNLLECSTVIGDKWAKMDATAELLNIENGKRIIATILRKKIKTSIPSQRHPG